MTFLRFTVVDGGTLHDVELSASPESTIASILDALPVRIGDRPAYVGPHRLRTDDTLADSHLTPGCVMSVGMPGDDLRRVPDDAVGVLHVIAGPDIGAWNWVPRAGGVLVGRGASAGLCTPGDAQVSREHAEVVANSETRGVTVLDVGSQNGTTVGGSRIDGATDLPAGGVLGVGESIVQWIPLERVDNGRRRAPDGWIEFDRRFHSAPTPEPVSVDLPAAPAASSRNALILVGSVAAPVGLGLVMFAVTGKPLTLLTSLLFPVTLLLPQLAERRNRRRQNAEFEEGKADATSQIVSAVTAQEQVRRLNDPDQLTLTLCALGLLPWLWTKRVGGRDALTVRVGVRDEPAAVDLRGQRWKGLSPPTMRAVPVTVDLATTGALSVVGDPSTAAALARWMLLQLATRRSPEDLSIYVFGRDGGEHLRWTAWLPHVDAGDLAPTPPCRIAVTPATRTALAEELKSLLDSRQAARDGTHAAGFDSDVVVLLDEARADRLLPGMRAVLQRGPDVGIHLICVDTDDIHECRGRVRIGPKGSLEIIRSWSDAPESASVETSGLDDAERLARLLAPMRDRVQTMSSAGGMPTRSRYLDLVDVAGPTPEAVTAFWSSHPGPTTRVPLGADERGPVTIDIAAQGPHVMLAGAPGAGKSILLETLVSSLLLHNRPDELNLILVDFKGGATFARFADIPHVVGVVTSTGKTLAETFDSAAADRLVRSTRAEAQRRERILSDYGGEIDEYLTRRPPGQSPLPRLMMIFDEFAMVRQAAPNLVQELVSITRTGRSLGIHLLFATQSLQSNLSAEMLNNIDLRISLRQNEASDSVFVLGTPDANLIPGNLKGRGYALCTKDQPRLARPFQTGYLRDRPPSSEAPPAQCRLVDWPAVGDPRPSDDGDTDAGPQIERELLLNALRIAAARLDPLSLHVPLRPPLPDQLALEDLPERTSHACPLDALAFGLADLPEEQAQPVEYLSLSGDEQLMIAGGSRSGRTTAIQALIHSAVTRFPPDRLHFYVLEREPAGLDEYEALPHCGGVFGPAGRDRIRRFVTWLAGETERRQTHRLAGGGAAPQILVLIDGWELIHDPGDPTSPETSLVGLLRGVIKNGPKVGVRTVVTCEHAAFARKPGDLFATRLVLPFPQADLVKSAILSGSVPPPRLAGRAAETSTGRHIQIAQPYESAAELTGRLGGSTGIHDGPRLFPALPGEVRLDELQRPSGVSAGWVPLGIGGPDLSAAGVDLFAGPQLLLVSGSADSGTADAAMAAALTLSAHGVGVVVITTSRSPVGPALAGRTGVAVLIGPTLPDSSVRAAASALGTEKVVMVVDECDQITVTETKKNAFEEAPTLLDEAVTPDRLGRMGVVLCGDAMPLLTGPRRGLYPLVRKALTEGASVLLLPNPPAARELNVKLEPDEYFSTPPGRGHLISGSHRTLIQLAVTTHALNLVQPIRLNDD